MWPSEILSYNLSASDVGWVINIEFDFQDETYYMKIYGDLIIYFGFISVVSVISWLSLKSIAMRNLLRQRILIAPMFVCLCVCFFSCENACDVWFYDLIVKYHFQSDN